MTQTLPPRSVLISTPIENELTCFSHTKILDSEHVRRRFRASNYLKENRTTMLEYAMPLCLNDGWNKVTFDLAQFTERTFGTSYTETMRVSVHANCRLRRVYFSEALYDDEHLPNDYRLYRTVMIRPKPKAVPLPRQRKGGARKKPDAKPVAEVGPGAEVDPTVKAVEVGPTAEVRSAAETGPAAEVDPAAEASPAIETTEI